MAYKDITGEGRAQISPPPAGTTDRRAGAAAVGWPSGNRRETGAGCAPVTPPVVPPPQWPAQPPTSSAIAASPPLNEAGGFTPHGLGRSADGTEGAE